MKSALETPLETQLETPPAIGHNSQNIVDILIAEPAAVYTQPSLLDELVAELEKTAPAGDLDLAKKANREAIAAAARRVSTIKGPIEEAGLALTEGWRKQTKAVNEIKTAVKTKLDQTRDKIRQPLTDWEAAQEEKSATAEKLIASYQALCEVVGASAEAIEARIKAVADAPSLAELGEFETRVLAERAKTLEFLKGALERQQQIEAERAELEALRKERAEREAREAEARAEQAAKEAEAARIAKAAQDAADAERAKAEAEIARLKAQQEADARAREEEKRRADEAARQQQAEAERRARDLEHRGTVMKAVKEALMEHAGISEAAAKKAVLAITGGHVPHTTIQF